jgi:Protein of unknown function (DUF2975)
MTRLQPDTLALSRSALRLLIVLNLVMGVLILGLLIASLVSERTVMGALGVRPVEGGARLIMAMRLIMVLGICAVPPTHIALTRLLAIVDSVRIGDPFVAVNAMRLSTIAWAVLGLELLHFIVGAVAAGASSAAQPLDLDWSFSVTRWLAVLLLFVLARVFDHGARMRADLDGTV